MSSTMKSGTTVDSSALDSSVQSYLDTPNRALLMKLKGELEHGGAQAIDEDVELDMMSPKIKKYVSLQEDIKKMAAIQRDAIRPIISKF